MPIKSGQFVIPGDKLGVIEEFIPGRGTFVKNGDIYSQISGHALINHETKQVSIYSRAKSVKIPKIGSLVLGDISQSQDKVAFVRILGVGNILLNKPFTGVLHVSFVTKFYLKSIHDAFKVGDVIVARVIGDQNYPVQLTTAERDLGVIEAHCCQCGAVLKFDRQQLICQICGRVERRKISDVYNRLP